jgi:hypothetical protein
MGLPSGLATTLRPLDPCSSGAAGRSSFALKAASFSLPTRSASVHVLPLQSGATRDVPPRVCRASSADRSTELRAALAGSTERASIPVVVNPIVHDITRLGHVRDIPDACRPSNARRRARSSSPANALKFRCPRGLTLAINGAGSGALSSLESRVPGVGSRRPRVLDQFATQRACGATSTVGVRCQAAEGSTLNERASSVGR